MVALAKQLTAFPFTGGVDTKSDPKQIPPPRLALLENASFRRPGQIRKWDGVRPLSRTIDGLADLVQGQALLSFRNGLLACNADTLFSRDVSADAWRAKGQFVSCNVTERPIVRDTNSQSQADSVTHPSGFEVSAWEDSSGGSRYICIDSSTGQILVPSTLIHASAIKPRVMAVGPVVVLTWIQTNDFRLYGSVISPGVPGRPLAPVALTVVPGGGDDTNAIDDAAPNYDSCVGAAGWYVAFNAKTAGTRINLFLASTPLGDPAGTAFIAGRVSQVLSTFVDQFSGGPVLICWNGTKVSLFAYSPAVGVSGTPQLLGSCDIETIANVATLTGVSISADALAIEIFYSASAANSFDYHTRRATVTGAYAVTTGPEDHLRSSGVAGKAFAYSGRGYVVLGYGSLADVPVQTLQSSYIVADAQRNIVARLLWANGGGIPKRSSHGSATIASTTQVAPAQFQFAALTADLMETQANTKTDDSGKPAALAVLPYFQTGVVSQTLDFNNVPFSYLRAELGRNLHLSGGFLSMYDGAGVTEHGFHFYPEPVQLSDPAGTDHEYWYCSVFTWADAAGNIHRSAPSVPVRYRPADPIDGMHTVALTLPTLRLTNKTPANGRSRVILEIYRTTDNQDVFRLASSPSSPTYNDTTADTVSFTDAITDTDLESQPQLYTTGGALENVEPPPPASLTVHRNRVFAVDSTDRLSVWYSKQCVAGESVEFNDSLTLDIDPRGGEVTAVASLDDKLIVFKQRSIFVVLGEGPDSTGGQNDFTDAQFVNTDVGCVTPRSVLLVPDGLVFQSEKGIYLLNRSLTASYVGAPVEAIVQGQLVTSGQVIPDRNVVVLTLDSGTAVAWDYLMQQWTVLTPLSAVDSVIWGDSFAYLRADGTAFVRTPGEFVGEDGRPVRLRAKTAWLQMGGLQGFLRLWRFAILGEWISAHTLQVSVATRFPDDNPDQVLQITPKTPGTWGSDSTWGGKMPGDSGVWGGAFPTYQWRVPMRSQRIQAVQILIEDLNVPTAEGEGFSLSGLSLEWGALPGLARLPAGQTRG